MMKNKMKQNKIDIFEKAPVSKAKAFGFDGKMAASVLVIVSPPFTLACILHAKPLVGLFLENKAAFDYGVHFTIISHLSGPICGVLYVLLNALQARGAAVASLAAVL